MTLLGPYDPITCVERGKILAVDLGTKNVGLAECDELAVTVTPLPSFPFRSRKALIERLEAAIAENSIASIVVGIPWNMDGSSGVPARRAQGFVLELSGALPIPVYGVDERLSTEEALGIWNEMTLRQRKRYRTVDSLAAALILERFLREG